MSRLMQMHRLCSSATLLAWHTYMFYYRGNDSSSAEAILPQIILLLFLSTDINMDHVNCQSVRNL